jgi:SAM-dependent methyltransferase
MYRANPREIERVASLFRLLPTHGKRILDVGARDGHLSKLLAERFDEVIALDLEQPDIVHPGVRPVKGDASRLEFADGSFDAVLCAEVLEHIPTPMLSTVSRELARAASGVVVIGVPFRQDLRLGQTTCAQCGGINPPWGHVNRFDEATLDSLFEGLSRTGTEFVGETHASTNALSVSLMAFAGNPYGTYMQDEPCIHCGGAIGAPQQRSVAQLAATKLAHWIDRAWNVRSRARPSWIHVRYACR